MSQQDNDGFAKLFAVGGTISSVVGYFLIAGEVLNPSSPEEGAADVFFLLLLGAIGIPILFAALSSESLWRIIPGVIGSVVTAMAISAPFTGAPWDPPLRDYFMGGFLLTCLGLFLVSVLRNVIGIALGVLCLVAGLNLFGHSRTTVDLDHNACLFKIREFKGGFGDRWREEWKVKQPAWGRACTREVQREQDGIVSAP